MGLSSKNLCLRNIFQIFLLSDWPRASALWLMEALVHPTSNSATTLKVNNMMIIIIIERDPDDDCGGDYYPKNE